MSNAQPVRANALRVTRADECGVPVAEATANSRVTTAGFIRVGLAIENITSSTISVPGASGATCVYSRGVDTTVGMNVTLELCNFNLSVMEILLGTGILTDYAAPVEDVGFVLGSDGSFNASTAMLEWWSINNNNEACATGGTNPARPYFHSVLPRVNRWTLGGNLDFGDNATTVTLTGFAEPSAAFAPSRAADEFTAADVTAANNANALYFGREVTTIPASVTTGYDL